MSKPITKCTVCEEQPAAVKITVTKIDGEYYDDTEVCLDCAQDPANELCLILPPKE